MNKEVKPKKKEKMVLAKDIKQGILAIIVLLLFIGNSVRMMVDYINQKNAEKQQIEQLPTRTSLPASMNHVVPVPTPATVKK